MRRSQGQAAAEYLLCVGLIAAALFLPFFEGRSVTSYLAMQVVEWFHGLYELLALT